MLFDLRGRGRRRTIQVIYASLALLMGGGLIFFGIGGNTNGGLFDAFSDSSGTSGSANEVVEKRLETLDARVKANPQDARAWAQLATARFQTATSGEGYDQATGQYTDKGKAELRKASAAWQRYLALDPPKVDTTVARQMVNAYDQAGLAQFDRAVAAQEIVIEAESNSPAAAYARLAILAHGAGQERKSDLAAEKAQELSPKDQRKQVKQAIDAGKSQLDQAKSGGAAAGTG